MKPTDMRKTNQENVLGSSSQGHLANVFNGGKYRERSQRILRSAQVNDDEYIDNNP
jgi:hypothetical protein